MQTTERFKDAPWFDKENKIAAMIGGAGGIGSWLAFFLSRAGFKTIVYDDDYVEAHNLGGQLFTRKDIGTRKVAALSKMISIFCEKDIHAIGSKLTNATMSHIFCFSAFDNMEARRMMFNVWSKNCIDKNSCALLIDGRLLMEQMQILCVTPKTAEEYEKKYLFSDAEAEDAPCTMRQTSHTAAMIAAFMTGFFTNHLTNIAEGDAVRDVPFYYEYFLPMNLSTERKPKPKEKPENEPESPQCVPEKEDLAFLKAEREKEKNPFI